MDAEMATLTLAQPQTKRAVRADSAVPALSSPPSGWWTGLVLVGLAVLFVAVGAVGQDAGRQEARLGLAARESVGPMGQVLGYWAPDLWPAQVLPSLGLVRLSAGGRASTATVHWPAALAAIVAGWMLAWSITRTLGNRAAILFGLCWFGSLALFDRSAGAGLDMILGLALLGTIDRLLRRRSDALAGLWASLAFLAGGWPPLVVIGLAVIVIGRPGSSFSLRLLLPPLGTAIIWSAMTIGMTSAEFWAASLALPLDPIAGLVARTERRPAGAALDSLCILALEPLGPGDLASRRPGLGHRLAPGGDDSLIAGTLVPGLGPAGAHPRTDRLARRRRGLPRIRLGPDARLAARRIFFSSSHRPGPLAHRDDLRMLRLEPDHALLPHPRHRHEPAGAGRHRPRLVGPRDRESPSRIDHPGLPGDRLEAGPLGLLYPRVELPPQSRPLGSRHRPVDPPEVVPVHLP